MNRRRRQIGAAAIVVLACVGCKASPSTQQERAIAASLGDVELPPYAPPVDLTLAASRLPPPIALAAYAQEDPAPAIEELPAPRPLPAPAPLLLTDVLQSVQQNYPLLEAAWRDYDIAMGKALASWGEFDLGVSAYGIAQPLGFYQNYRNGIGLAQPLWPGGYVYGGYRIGDGFFPEWYGERQTNEGGEFKMGFAAPLLQGRAIDKRRAGVWQAALARDAVAPAVQSQQLDFVRLASQAYWNWVGAGLVLQLQNDLLRLAQDRVMQIEERIRVGDLEPIAGITNRQLIATREARVIEAERKLQAAAIKLSLFLRTPMGEPIVPPPALLPGEFPAFGLPDERLVARDIDRALAARPELQELELLREQVRVELAQADNQLLPKVEAKVEGSKDVGGEASIKGDKTPFELEAGLYGEVPLQRREAQGKVRAAQGKLAQLTAKRRFTVDKITAEVRDAYSALRAAALRTDRARTNYDLARQSLDLARLAFEAGDIDVVVLNLYEQAVADARLSLISAEADFFFGLADYRAALALPAIAQP